MIVQYISITILKVSMFKITKHSVKKVGEIIQRVRERLTKKQVSYLFSKLALKINRSLFLHRPIECRIERESSSVFRLKKVCCNISQLCSSVMNFVPNMFGNVMLQSLIVISFFFSYYML